jgi:hypothetical protein
MALALELRTPLAAVAVLAAGPGLAVAGARIRRARALARSLGAQPGRRRGALAVLLVPVGVALLLGAALAQPVLLLREPTHARRDAQAIIAVDVSRSMLARAAPRSPSRYDRALALARQLRAGLPDVPTGLVSLTDRALPQLFPGTSAADLDAVLARSLAVGRPPPTAVEHVATDVGSLSALATDRFFPGAVTRRVVIALTDGESAPFAARQTVAALRSHGTSLVVVRLWHPGERIFWHGRPVPGYRADPALERGLDDLARLGVPVLGQGDPRALVAAARRALGSGPSAAVGSTARRVPLALPLLVLALAGLLPLVAASLGLARPARLRSPGAAARASRRPWTRARRAAFAARRAALRAVVRRAGA